MVHGVANVWVPVTDMSRAVRFYGETLGLRAVQQDDAWSEFDANGLRVGLNAREAESPAGGGGAVIAFQPEGGLDAAVQELRGQGVEFVGDISDHPWGRIASFRDPDGNDLQLYEPPKG